MSAVEGWETKTLSEIADITMGQSPDSKYYTEEEQGLPFIQGCAEFTSRFPNPKLHCTQIKKVAKTGSILFSVRAPVGRINIADQPYIIGRGLAAIFAKGINQELLERCVDYQEPFFRAASQGSTFEAINTAELSKWLISFPSNPVEQTKIAEILSCIDTAIEQTEAIIAKQQRIKTGLMQDLLSKGIDEHGNIRSEHTHAFKDSPLGRIPEEWEIKQLGQIFQLKSGITPLRSNTKYFDFNGYNWVKTLDLNENYLFTTEEKISDFALKNTSISLMPKNSLLVAMYGGWEQIGRTAILGYKAATNQAITCLYNAKIDVEPEFAQIALQYFRYTWRKFAVSTRKDPNITKTDIENFLIPFPCDIREQKEISKIIFNVKQDIDILNNQLVKL